MERTFRCTCGKVHDAKIDTYEVGRGVLSRLPRYIKKYGGTKAFVLADKNTYAAAGEAVCRVLSDGDIPFASFVFEEDRLAPDEKTVGKAVMHFDSACDIVIGVGSGVINDTGKILAKLSGVPYIVVATAPSMDGYASCTSSMDVDGLKVSLPTTCANVVLGDIDILKNAPERMLVAGLGDMLAKYVSLAEWKIAHIVTGEYYCETVAALVREALQKCVENAAGLLKREEKAIAAVFEGLILGGAAMNYAGLSRPASGVEHYFSHVWDMRGLALGTKTDFHGIQCAVGTLYAARGYDCLIKTVPDRERARKNAQAFSYPAYAEELKAFLGKGADAMIELEEKEGKYDPVSHEKRLAVLLANWDEILQIIETEIPRGEEIEAILDEIRCPKSMEELGMDGETLQKTFLATKDIRDKYVLSRLCWDLGIADEILLA